MYFELYAGKRNTAPVGFAAYNSSIRLCFKRCHSVYSSSIWLCMRIPYFYFILVQYWKTGTQNHELFNYTSTATKKPVHHVGNAPAALKGMSPSLRYIVGVQFENAKLDNSTTYACVSITFPRFFWGTEPVGPKRLNDTGKRCEAALCFQSCAVMNCHLFPITMYYRCSYNSSLAPKSVPKERSGKAV